MRNSRFCSTTTTQIQLKLKLHILTLPNLSNTKLNHSPRKSNFCIIATGEENSARGSIVIPDPDSFRARVEASRQKAERRGGATAGGQHSKASLKFPDPSARRLTSTTARSGRRRWTEAVEDEAKTLFVSAYVRINCLRICWLNKLWVWQPWLFVADYSVLSIKWHVCPCGWW